MRANHVNQGVIHILSHANLANFKTPCNVVVTILIVFCNAPPDPQPPDRDIIYMDDPQPVTGVHAHFVLKCLINGGKKRYGLYKICILYQFKLNLPI